MENDAREDLAMIRRLMSESRRTVDAGGPHYLIWGVLITAALVGTWAHQTGRLATQPVWIWSVAVGLGWILSMIVGIRGGRRAEVRTAGGRIMAGIWVGTGVTLTLAGFLGTGSGTLTGDAMLGLTASLIGSALFASSFVLRPTPYRWLAVGWWAGAVPLFLWRDPGAQLLLAGMTVAFMLVPGVWLLLGRDDGSADPGVTPSAEGTTP